MLLGTAVLLLTVMGHTSGGRWSSMDTASLVLLWPLAVALSLVAADRRRSAPWLFVFVMGVQALFHVLLSIASGHAPHSEPLWPSTTMIMGHLVAGAATAVVLAHGDRILHAWLAFWAMLARGRVTRVAVPPMLPMGLPCYVAPILKFRASGTAISRRGPPVLGA
jgi:hypothetical protein